MFKETYAVALREIQAQSFKLFDPREKNEGGRWSNTFDVEADQKWASLVMVEVLLLFPFPGSKPIGGIYLQEGRMTLSEKTGAILTL